MDIIETKTTEEFVKTAAQWITSAIHAAAKDGHSPFVGLSGGSTPAPVYTMLPTDLSIPWDHVTFFLTDERYVPADSADSNQRMVRSTLLTRAASNARFLAPDTSLSLPACIAAYAETLKGLKPDLAILGMGTDGHITSLFPPLPPEAYGPDDVIHTTTDKFAGHDRISLTFPILERSKKRVFLISGNEKKALLAKMQDDSQDVNQLPAVALLDEHTTWIVGP